MPTSIPRTIVSVVVAPSQTPASQLSRPRLSHAGHRLEQLRSSTLPQPELLHHPSPPLYFALPGRALKGHRCRLEGGE
jgi:hypothetical protein